VAAAYRIWAGLTSLAVIVQIGLAGVGAFHAAHKAEDNEATKKTVEDWFGPHISVGYILGPVIIVLLILAIASRRSATAGGHSRVKWAAILLGLWVVQVLLAWIGGVGNGALGFLHPINALLIAGIAGVNAQRAWQGSTMRPGVPATPAP
jgi:hypothetical protein